VVGKIDLSIIIVNYNTKDFLQKCLESVISQWSVLKQKSITSYQPPVTEIIIVDNGSTDGSVEEIKNLKSKMKNYNLKLNIFF